MSIFKKDTFKAYSGLIVASLGVCAVSLIVIGHFLEAPQDAAPIAVLYGGLYRAAQAFVLNGKYDEINIFVAAGQAIATLIFFGIALGLFWRYMREAWHQIQAWTYSDHVIICGGDNQSAEFVETFIRGLDELDAKPKVVFIPNANASQDLGIAKHESLAILRGNPTNAAVLRRARVARAAHLIAVSGNDSTNVAIVSTASQVKRHWQTPLECHIGTSSDGYYEMIEEIGVQSLRNEKVVISALGGSSAIALEMFADIKSRYNADSNSSRVIFVGHDGAANQLIKLLNAWQESLALTNKFEVIVFGENAESWIQDISQNKSIESGSITLSAQNIDLYTRHEITDLVCSKQTDLLAVVVCIGDENQAVCLSHRLSGLVKPEVNVLAQVQSSLSVIENLTEISAGDLGRPQLRVFDQAVCMAHPKYSLQSVPLSLATSIHGDWRQLASAQDLKDRPELNRVWSEIPDWGRAQNYRQARNIIMLSHQMGARLVRADYSNQPAIVFSEGLVHVLAGLEHESWRRSLEAKGWRYGPVRDERKRHNPVLRPWDDLSDDEQAQTKQEIEKWPTIIGRCGFRIIAEQAPLNDEQLEQFIPLLGRISRENYLLRTLGSLDGETWCEITQDEREQNISQVRANLQRYTSEGYRVALAGSAPSEKEVKIDPTILERLAVEEHERWVIVKQSQGWKYGPVKDEDMKIHPNLVPWDDLVEFEKNLDRDPISEFVNVLERAGLQLINSGTSAGRDCS